jgi:G3E family GTPase
MKTRIMIVGGFLGAGKTTLLWESARHLTAKGKRVGLITNDQASELVDTAFLERANDVVLEVSGSCFCCNFNGFTDAISQAIAEKHSEIIIAEPVGSCTDLSATILQPLKEKFQDTRALAPLTVLTDPEKLLDILEGGTSGLHENAAYIFRKQLEEADIILINKSDLLSREWIETLKQRASKEWPLAHVSSISARTGEGLAQWLDEVLEGSDAGTHLAQVDYDRYAEGEAVLGWMNACFNLKGYHVDWDAMFQSLMESLSLHFDQSGAAVGHMKLLMEKDGLYAIGNLTGRQDTLRVRGAIGSGNQAKLTLNARVQMPPDALENTVQETLSMVCGDHIEIVTIGSTCLSPGRPNPTYRYNHVV